MNIIILIKYLSIEWMNFDKDNNILKKVERVGIRCGKNQRTAEKRNIVHRIMKWIVDRWFIGSARKLPAQYRRNNSPHPLDHTGKALFVENRYFY